MSLIMFPASHFNCIIFYFSELYGLPVLCFPRRNWIENRDPKFFVDHDRFQQIHLSMEQKLETCVKKMVRSGICCDYLHVPAFCFVDIIHIYI